MDKNTTTDLKVAVPDYGVLTKTFPQYGMRYPDGTIKWVQARTHTGHTVNFKELADGNQYAQENWSHGLQRQAVEAKIDPAEYEEAHRVVKRTVILAVAELETA